MKVGQCGDATKNKNGAHMLEILKINQSNER